MTIAAIRFHGLEVRESSGCAWRCGGHDDPISVAEIPWSGFSGFGFKGSEDQEARNPFTLNSVRVLAKYRGCVNLLLGQAVL
jgi:hypothetical protein